MYGLPPQLTGQAIEAIRVNLRDAIELRDEIKDLKPVQRWQINSYVTRVHDLLLAVFHGERDRFAYPQIMALQRLEALQEKDASTLSNQFSTSKTALVSSLNGYIKGLQLGLRQHDSEAA